MRGISKALFATSAATRLATASLLAMLALAALASQASAVTYFHPFISAFGPDGTSLTRFGGLSSAAVDQSSHDVFVTQPAEPGKAVLHRFTANGERHKFTEGPSAGSNRITGLTGVSQVAVALPGSLGGTGRDIYITTASGVQVYSPEGVPLGVLDGSGNPNPHPAPGPEFDPDPYACAVTTDFAGNVYVGYCFDNLSQRDQFEYIEKYTPSGNPVANTDFDSEITGFHRSLNGLPELAASGSRLYAPGGIDLSAFPGGGGSVNVTSLSTIPIAGSYVDPSNEDVYFAEGDYLGTGMVQFDKDGNRISIIRHLSDELPDAPYGVAVDGTSGNVYIVNEQPNGSNAQMRIYGDGILVPPASASIDPVSSVTYKSAHFSGTVASGAAGVGQETTYRFICNPGCSGLQGERSITADGVGHAVFDDATDLTPETKYEVTLIAKNRAGEVQDTVEFETPAKPATTAPSVTIDAVTSFTATSAQLSGTIDPGGEGENQETTYRFEYSADGLLWLPMAELGPIVGTGPQQVSVRLEGLEPNSTYLVRLRAENDGGEDLSDGPDPSFTTEGTPPTAEATAATHVLDSTAQLNARVNPRGQATTYYFQWGSGDCASNPCASVPISHDAEAGAGRDYVFVKAQIAGLSPDSTYSYRLIAQSAGGQATSLSKGFRTAPAPGACPNATLRGGASTALPGCRAYEMVSPLDKNGGNVSTWPWATRVASDGDAVTYHSLAGFAGTPGSNDYGSLYLGRRGANGWSARGITPQHEVAAIPSIYSSSGFIGTFSSDLSKGVFRSLTPLPGVTSANVGGVSNLYLGSSLGGENASMQLVSDASAPLTNDHEGFDTSYKPHIGLGGASADFEHIAFESDYNLTPQASGEERKAYEWADGQVRLVGVLPDSACASPPCPAASSVLGGSASWGFSGGGNGMFTAETGAVSDDGSRIFFTAGWPSYSPPFPGTRFPVPGDLYLREDGTRTVQIDASERSIPRAGDSGQSTFQWATPDGSRVFFLSNTDLTDDDNDGGEGRDLYRYDVDAPAGQHLTLLTPELRTPDALGISYVIAASEDGEFLYFLGKAPQGSTAAQGIYVLHGDMVRLVGVKDKRLSFGEDGARGGYRQVAVSRDGRHLLLGSYDGQGLGYDNVAPPKVGEWPSCSLSGAEVTEDRQSGGGRCRELFLYSYDSDTLRCASCNPSGAPPRGNASYVASLFNSSEGQENLPQPMSEDGRHVFFDSRDALVPEDTNGKIDVYLYEAETGKLALISSGQCNCDSYFVGASPDGEDVFFTTKEQLVRKDADSLYDIYDARVGGGIASQNQLPPQECEGDACQGAPSGPLDPTPASAGLSGPGNPPVTRKKPRAHCPKAKRRVKGRCVKHGAKKQRENRSQGKRG